MAVAGANRDAGDEPRGTAPEDDARLVARALDGDDAAFAELARRSYPRVARIAGRFFRQPDVVEEIAQEVYVKAFVALGSWQGQVPLERWLARIAVNACYDELRRRRRTGPVSSTLVENRVGDPDLWEREETRLWAEEVLARLPAAERLVLTLTVLEDLSVAEVAEITGWSKVNVKVRAFRARRRLRQLLAADPGGARSGKVSDEA
jgi:RNA polymerase sigma-70 factor (ECF subfamily)